MTTKRKVKWPRLVVVSMLAITAGVVSVYLPPEISGPLIPLLVFLVGYFNSFVEEEEQEAIVRPPDPYLSEEVSAHLLKMREGLEPKTSTTDPQTPRAIERRERASSTGETIDDSVTNYPELEREIARAHEARLEVRPEARPGPLLPAHPPQHRPTRRNKD